ncbi:MAG: SpoIIE family protein phosphatase [Flavobacteriales bacterium]|jgi:ligand-binding sensor domain-containing protein/serine phosphatase RsbU (regulator of sigma subunit)|nr:SpoIIE family protein phosphatase [Flavobacteriales bacterium]
MKLVITLFCLFQLLLITNSYAQHYNFKGISVEEGLPRSGAYSLLQDSKGYLWVTLDGGGVARYDGQHFKTIDLSNGLPSRKVRAIFEDSKKNLWFGTTQGLCKYEKGKLKVYTTKNGLPHNYIRAINEDKSGHLIIGTNKGIASYDGIYFTTLNDEKDSTFNPKIRTIHTTKDNITYIGSEHGLYRIKDQQIILSEYTQLLPNPTVLSIQDDSKGNLWIGTEQGVIAYHHDSVRLYNQQKGLISNRIRAICEDNNHNIWIGTRTGVSCITSKKIININSSNGLTHERIRDILLDNNGTLWFATFYGGINNFNPKDFITFSTNEGLLSNQILSISETSNNKIIAGTFDGVSTFQLDNGNIQNITNYTTLNGLPHNRTYSIYKDNYNFIWLGTKKGIVVTNDFQNFTPIKDSLSDIQSEIYTIIQENKNTYWAGGEDGLFQITFSKFPHKYIILQYNNEDIPSNDISSLAIDHNKNIWIGYRHGGIRIKKNNGGGFITPTFSKKIENISSIVIKNDKVWIGTDTKGLFCIETPQIDQEIAVKQYTYTEGLSSSNIYAIASTRENEIWVGSEKGVDKLIFEHQNNQLFLKNIEHYGKEDGISGGEIIEKSILVNKKNQLLLGTVKGLVSSSAMNYTALHEPPKLHLLKFESFNKDKEQKENHITNLDNISIEYSSNNISLDFIGIDLNSPNKVKYKWYLEGYSKKWSPPTKRSFLNFTNLIDKKYRLMIKSAGVNNIWNETPLVVNFTIKTPYWKSIWFIILITIIIITIVYSGVKWKINQLIRQREVLEQKIQAATKTIEEEKLLIEEQSHQIFEQKELLEEQHREIKQSIDYAQLIQEASLPEKKITDLIADSFLYYNPRDIVSGDFYWWEEKNDYILFCVADSTGHGIPGAFISLIGTILSNEIFYSKKLIYPNKILDELNKTVQITLEQHLPNPKIKDGMDLSFCCYNKQTKKLYFSGANNPVWLVRHNNHPLIHNSQPLAPNFTNNHSNLYEVKGDKQPIGLHAVKQHPFTLHEINIEKGDEIYLFTDGYADQFGGDKNKKFMSKRFKQLLTSNEGITMQKAKTLIDLNFSTWKGEYPQVDDVCVVGVRF